jgi:hypothetical protein
VVDILLLRKGDGCILLIIHGAALEKLVRQLRMNDEAIAITREFIVQIIPTYDSVRIFRTVNKKPLDAEGNFTSPAHCPRLIVHVSTRIPPQHPARETHGRR